MIGVARRCRFRIRTGTKPRHWCIVNRESKEGRPQGRPSCFFVLRITPDTLGMNKQTAAPGGCLLRRLRFVRSVHVKIDVVAWAAIAEERRTIRIWRAKGRGALDRIERVPRLGFEIAGATQA